MRATEPAIGLGHLHDRGRAAVLGCGDKRLVILLRILGLHLAHPERHEIIVGEAVGVEFLLAKPALLPRLCTGFDASLSLLALLVFPAVALASNCVWNLHYLLAATKRAGGQAESDSPVGILMVVALSFLIFYPAGWTALEVGRHRVGHFSEPLAFATFLAVQYAVDLLLVLMLARLFQRFEVSRDSR